MLHPHHKMATESSHGRSRIAAAPVDAEALGGSGGRRSVVGRAPLDDHALMCHGFAEGGASMGLGFWSIRYSISTQRPALRRVSASKYYMHPEAFYHARRPRC